MCLKQRAPRGGRAAKDQRRAVQECKSGRQRNMFVLMDDCMYDKKVLKSLAMRDLFMNGRHMNVTATRCST